MKKLNLLVLVAGVCFCFASYSVQAQVRILPYGDSVTTFGSDPESSYRYWLYQDLVGAGFNFIFVGTRSGVEDGSPANDWPQEAYSGHEGWSSYDASVNASSIASATDPDIVLLDFGSNDFDSGADNATTLAQTEVYLEQTIENLRTVKPNVIILLAEPTPWPTSDPHEKQFMSKLKGTISKVAKAEGVIKVNLFGGFSVKNDVKDISGHPNVRGEQKIAKKYFSALRKVL
jgi:hypothetical protein